MVRRIPNFVSESISLPFLAIACAEANQCILSMQRIAWSHTMFARLHDNYKEVLRFEANRNGCDDIEKYIKDWIPDDFDYGWLTNIYGVHYLRRTEYFDNFEMETHNILDWIQRQMGWLHTVYSVNLSTIHLFRLVIIRTKSGTSVTGIFARHSNELPRLSEFTLNELIAE